MSVHCPVCEGGFLMEVFLAPVKCAMRSITADEKGFITYDVRSWRKIDQDQASPPSFECDQCATKWKNKEELWKVICQKASCASIQPSLPPVSRFIL